MARKKKEEAKQPVALPKAPPAAGATASVPPVALLIDGENTIIPDHLAYVLVEAGRMGGVTIRHIYGNWAAPSMQTWKKYVAHYELEQVGNRPGQNATDIALVIGAMDLLARGIKHFCLVTGDSDYVPLVSRLRQDGCTVLVIGSSAASQALKEASSRFLSIDQLLPQTASSASPPLATSSSQTPKLSALLIQAYQSAAQKQETEWVLLAQVGQALRQQNPTLEATYGKKHLSVLIQQCSGDFETRKSPRGNGQVEEVRLRPKRS